MLIDNEGLRFLFVWGRCDCSDGYDVKNAGAGAGANIVHALIGNKWQNYQSYQHTYDVIGSDSGSELELVVCGFDTMWQIRIGNVCYIAFYLSGLAKLKIQIIRSINNCNTTTVIITNPHRCDHITTIIEPIH